MGWHSDPYELAPETAERTPKWTAGTALLEARQDHEGGFWRRWKAFETRS
ncbi:MAG: hypothetical protein ACON4R_08150 [Akkermansiaceae bacterium]